MVTVISPVYHSWALYVYTFPKILWLMPIIHRDTGTRIRDDWKRTRDTVRAQPGLYHGIRSDILSTAAGGYQRAGGLLVNITYQFWYGWDGIHTWLRAWVQVPRTLQKSPINIGTRICNDYNDVSHAHIHVSLRTTGTYRTYITYLVEYMECMMDYKKN
jgi:hypothetical protein